MTSRREQEAPAIVITLAAAIVLLAVGVPLAIREAIAIEGSDKSFDVAWTQSDVGKATASDNAGTVTVTSGEILPASITVTVIACTDTKPLGAAQADAVIHAKVTRGETVLLDADIACTVGARLDNTTSSPDIGKAQGSNAEDALASVKVTTASSRMDGDYVLEITSTRADSQVPGLPVPQTAPSLTYQIELKVTQWDAAVSTPAEVGK